MARNREQLQEFLPRLDFDVFSGINNQDKRFELNLDELILAINLNINNKGKISSREGYTKKLTPSSTCHSLFSDGTTCLFVDGSTLKKLNTDYTSTTLRSNVSTLPMSYAPVNDVIYYSNATVNGYVKNGADNQFSDPDKEFKTKPPTAQYIEYYNARLYFGRNEVLFYTDSLAYGMVDYRRNFIMFEDEICMLRAVEDGIWVGVGRDDKSKTYFLRGRDAKEFNLSHGTDVGVMEGTDTPVDNLFLGDGKSKGKSVIWVSEDGDIVIGGNSGEITKITRNKFRALKNRFGSGGVINSKNSMYYVTTLWS